MALNLTELSERINGAVPGAVSGLEEASGALQIAPDAIREVGLYLRDEQDLSFDFLMCLSGVDNADGTLGVVYHLYSMGQKHKVTLKVTVPKDAPNVRTVEKVWRTAEWHEREAYDLVGVLFDGHSDLRRILCPYDWEGHPLQKDYKQPEYYLGMKVPY